MAERLLSPKFVGLALGLALMLACFPSGVEAGMVRSMASRAPALTPRQAREAEVSRLLGEEKVAQALATLGLTPAQVRSRLARMDDPHLDQLAQNLETIRAGRSPIIGLLAVAIILLGVIIYMQIEQA